ncbi:MAG TPA: PAS domain-containing sensor histidine kinase [Chloroflexota bacterium]|nr:PAS domain-containing sensor histidine kinase [Chloroflexota bacterium]
MNETIAQATGHSGTELIGSNVWDLYPADKAKHRRIIVHRVVETGQPMVFVDRDGDQWYETLVQPLWDDGQIRHLALYARNITLQIRAEERLKHTSLQLVTAEEDERRRIAQDLHDDIGQRMTALTLSLKAIQSAVTEGDKGAVEQLKDAIRMAESIMRQVRQILYQLRPPLLATLPLAKVLEELCSSIAQSSRLSVDFSSEPDVPAVPEIQAMAFYRCVQEGLNNVVRHAKATSVWVNLDCVDGELSVSLEDDGQGFEPDYEQKLGLGLQGIRDRFLMLGGTFSIESKPGCGTRLFGSVPLAGATTPYVGR